MGIRTGSQTTAENPSLEALPKLPMRGRTSKTIFPGGTWEQEKLNKISQSKQKSANATYNTWEQFTVSKGTLLFLTMVAEYMPITESFPTHVHSNIERD